MGLPKIDLSKFSQGNEVERREAADAIVDSLKAHGFVKLVNHGISDAEVRNFFDTAKSFFRLPENVKGSAANPPGPQPQRGWSRVGAENSSTLYGRGLLGKEVSEELKDAREHFDQGSVTDPDYPNRWPEDEVLPGFRKTMESAYVQMETVCAYILEAMEVGLEIPAGSFTGKCTSKNSASEFRVLHYPSITVETIRQGKVDRIWPHFDLGVITLLFQDGIGGLEYEDRGHNGEKFCEVECGKTSDLVVNISETMGRWTNDVVPAGLHRVSLPNELKDKTEGVLPDRYSMAYFCKADRNASVAPLKQFLERAEDKGYDDITALEYHQRRLATAYN